MNWTIWLVTVSVGELLISFEMNKKTEPTDREIWSIVNDYLDDDIGCEQKIVSVKLKEEPVQQKRWNVVFKDNFYRCYKMEMLAFDIPIKEVAWSFLHTQNPHAYVHFNTCNHIAETTKSLSNEMNNWHIAFVDKDGLTNTFVLPFSIDILYPSDEDCWTSLFNHDKELFKKYFSVKQKHVEPAKKEEVTIPWRAIVKDNTGKGYEILGEGYSIPGTADIWQLLASRYGSLSHLFRDIISIQKALRSPSEELKQWTVKFEMRDKSIYTTTINYPTNLGRPSTIACWTALFEKEKASLDQFIYVGDVVEFVEPTQEDKVKTVLKDIIKSIETLLN